jgi:hypothetical protein
MQKCHRLDPGILGRSRTRLIPKTLKPMFSEAPTSLANGVGINTEAGRHDLALLAFSTGQYDPNPQRQRLSVLRRDASDVNSAAPHHRAPAGQSCEP